MIRSFLCVLSICIQCLHSTSTFAAGGTQIVAQKGQKTYENPNWPNGVADILNDPSRTTGWNSWFTEWPNDVNHYAMEIDSMDDLNRLIVMLARVKSELKEVHLCWIPEPRGLGWVTSLEEGNNIPVIFSLGDQKQIDQWYANVRKPFGVMEFTDTPVAVPPTLTIFVQNPLIKLDELKIPSTLDVKAAYLPGTFFLSKTTIEKALEDSKSDKPLIDTSQLEGDTKRAAEQIIEFLMARQGSAKQ